MNKNRFTILVLSLAVLLIAGCSSSTPAVYDESVPQEERCTLTINNFLEVTHFDNDEVNWITSQFNRKQVTIPTGTHRLRVTTSAESTSGYGTGTLTITQQSGTVELVQEFLPGHEYFVIAFIDEGADKIAGVIVDDAQLDTELTPDPSSPAAAPFEGEWMNTALNKYHLMFSGNQFATINNGKYQGRGYWVRQGNTVTMPLLFLYSKGKWTLAPSPNTILTLFYNGTAFTNQSGRIVYTKME